MINFLLIICFLLSTSVFSQEEQLLVGISGVDMEPKIGIPLAGYGAKERRLNDFIDWKFQYSESTLFKPSEGVHSPIRSKVMILKKGQQMLAFISLDTIGIENRFVKDISFRMKSFGLQEKDIVISATHTHGGPGTLSNRIPLMAVAVDLYRPKNYQHILNKVSESIIEAIKNLRPAQLYKSKAKITGVQKNKWRENREDFFDDRASFLLAKELSTGDWMGGLVNFSIHGGTMPIPLMLYSSDVNGAIEKEIEIYLANKNTFFMHSPVMLFMNGAEGDVAGDSERSVENVTLLAHKFILDAAPALEDKNLTPISSEFSSSKKKIFVGIPRLQLHDCQDGFLGKLPNWIKPSISPLLPAFSYISKIMVGDITYLTWPGEASTQLGFDLQEEAIKRGAKDPIVLGLVNDYMTYFTTKSEYSEKEYDSCSSFYGWKGGKRIIDSHKKWL
jgi:hypothetical protein